MIEMKLANSSTITEVCNKFNIEETPRLQIYVAKEKDEILGYCGFEIEKEEGRIVFANVTDSSLMMIEDGLIRAALALMFYDRGVKTAVNNGNVEAPMLTRLGFKNEDNMLKLNLEDSFLTKGCGCSK